MDRNSEPEIIISEPEPQKLVRNILGNIYIYLNFVAGIQWTGRPCLWRDTSSDAPGWPVTVMSGRSLWIGLEGTLLRMGPFCRDSKI